ncbi:MAG: hypothetical protein NZ729_00970 [Methylococcales bacterium]|nr:hypothetical protein [Methylococcales bacterium]
MAGGGLGKLQDLRARSLWPDDGGRQASGAQLLALRGHCLASEQPINRAT